MSLQDSIQALLDGFARAVGEPLKGNPVASLPKEIAVAVEEVIGDDSYKVQGSPGRGRWAETPWVAVFDRLVTETAQRGFYIVYLFRADGSGVFLSLNQETTEVYDEHGVRYLDVLTLRAQSYASLLADRIETLDSGPIDLGGSGTLTRGYEAGSIAGRFYPSGSILFDPDLDKELKRDAARKLDTLLGGATIPRMSGK